MKKFMFVAVASLAVLTAAAFSGCGQSNQVETIRYVSTENSNILNRCEYDGEIKNGTKLIVDDGQVLVVVKDNDVVEVFQTGEYVVGDENESKFDSSEIYYISTKPYEDIKWATTEPIKFEDIEHGELYLGAYGTYSYQISDAEKFVTAFLDENNEVTVDDYTKNIIVKALEKGISDNGENDYLNLASVGKEKLIDENIADIGIDFTVDMDALMLTDESEQKIEDSYKDMFSSAVTSTTSEEVVESSSFKANVHILTKEEGGRRTPFFSNYKPELEINSKRYIAVCKLENVEAVFPGDDAVITFEFNEAVEVNINDTFTMIENDKIIGSGVITEIL